MQRIKAWQILALWKRWGRLGTRLISLCISHFSHSLFLHQRHWNSLDVNLILLGRCLFTRASRHPDITLLASENRGDALSHLSSSFASSIDISLLSQASSCQDIWLVQELL